MLNDFLLGPFLGSLGDLLFEHLLAGRTVMNYSYRFGQMFFFKK